MITFTGAFGQLTGFLLNINNVLKRTEHIILKGFNNSGMNYKMLVFTVKDDVKYNQVIDLSFVPEEFHNAESGGIGLYEQPN